MRDDKYQAELETISQTCSTPEQYKAAVAKLNARRQHEAVAEILQCSRETSTALRDTADTLRDVAARLDSGTQTREEMEALRAAMAALRDALTETETSGELPAGVQRSPAPCTESLWTVIRDRPLLVVCLVLALLVLAFAGREISSSWLSISPSSAPSSQLDSP